MSPRVDLYNSSYANYERDAYREVRLATYGEDFGQTSWVTTEESREIPQRLELTPGCSVLEIGCGSGRYALYVAESARCRVVGLDLNAEGICRLLTQVMLALPIASAVGIIDNPGGLGLAARCFPCAPAD